MLQPLNNKVTASCPAGHKVRGDSSLVGKTVKCPRCKVKFVFALTFKPSDQSDGRKVTDTGVMRILGEMDAVPSAPKRRAKTHRHCTRCGASVPESTAVCHECECYLGVLPAFLKDMASTDPQLK